VGLQELETGIYGFVEQEPNPTEIVAIHDVDSTVSRKEGINELALIHGLADEVEALTNRAMGGEVPFDDVFGLRLNMIDPQEDDLICVGQQYLAHVTPYAKETIALLQRHGVAIHLVSGGYKDAILPLSRFLGVDDTHVWANTLEFHHDGTEKDGTYKGFDTKNPLCRRGGKAEVIKQIKAMYPAAATVAMIGDSIPDMRESRGLANLRIAFGGHVMRPGIENEPDILIRQCSLASLVPILLPQETVIQLFQNSDTRPFIIQALQEIESIIASGGANGWTQALICKVQPLVVSLNYA
jgi:phosphoserine phosphatase